jgi:prolyl-tRNA synthetase
MYSKWLNSYRDLPYLYNQWCSVVRWEKTTRPFLRTSEFLWQEGHTLHETAEEAQKETLQMLDIYRQVAEDLLAMPVVIGQKSEKEKFAGADSTYTMEAMMHDGKALQAGTSHNLGQHFSKMFDIKYLDRDGEQKYGWSTSWGISTRLIGGIIMVHGDNRGLVMPPRIAPTQVVIVPIASHKEGVLDKAYEIKKELQKDFRLELDNRENYSPGWKFNEWEMRGVPLRIEIGPKDVANETVVFARRDIPGRDGKSFIPMAEVETQAQEMLVTIHKAMFDTAVAFRDANTSRPETYEEFKAAVEDGWAISWWCGDRQCEDAIKAETKATSRNIPMHQEGGTGKCIHCGKDATEKAVFSKAY